MKVLALDIGRRTGFALGNSVCYGNSKGYGGEVVDSGVWLLDAETVPERFLQLRSKLLSFKDKSGRCEFQLLAYERPFGILSRLMAESLHGYATTAILFAMENNLRWTRIPPTDIKKHATGSGRANKASMVCEAKLRWPDLSLSDNNQCDALWLLDYVCEGLSVLSQNGLSEQCWRSG